MSEQKIKCCAKVYPAAMNFPRARPCTRNAGIERDGKWYCGSHDPVKKAERAKASWQKFEKRDAERMKDWRLRSAASELLEALEQALRYMEVSVAYRGAMTAAQVEQQIALNSNISVTEIGANSCNTLAKFNFEQARAAIKKARGES